MILYRIINEEEYNAIKNGTINLIEKTPANRYYGQINRVYKTDSAKNANQYLYFFEDVEACENGWNGEYILQVDIPEKLLEKGYGRYASLGSAFSRYITMDEFRIKKEEFDKDKHLLGIVPREKIPDEWRETSHKYHEAVEKGLEQRYLYLNTLTFEEYKDCPITMLDASGLRGEILDVFTIPEELNDVCRKINGALTKGKKIHSLSELQVREYEPNDEWRWNDYRYTVQGILHEMSKHYTSEQINDLFAGELSVNRIFDIARIMTTGEIQLSEGYSRHIGMFNYDEDKDIKYAVALILAKNDISEEKYNDTRHELTVIFSDHRNLAWLNEKNRIECIDFIYNEENRKKIPDFSNKYEKDSVIEDIVDIFAVNPDCGKEVAEYFFIPDNNGKVKNSYTRISFYETICKKIEKFNQAHPDSKIANMRSFELVKKLDEIGVNLDGYDRNINNLESSEQLLEFLSQSGSELDNIEELLQQFELLPKKTQERPSELPYSDERIAEGVASINPHELETEEQPTKQD